VSWWLSDWTGKPHTLPGADAVQYGAQASPSSPIITDPSQAGGHTYDLSFVSSSFPYYGGAPHVTPAKAPAAPAEPVAVILAAVLHFLSPDAAAEVCATYVSRAAQGSWLILSTGHYQDVERHPAAADRHAYPVLESRRRGSGVDAGRARARRAGSVRGAQLDIGGRRRADGKAGVRPRRRRRQAPVTAAPALCRAY